MRFLKLFIAVLFSCSVFAQQEFVVQSNHSGQIYTSALDSKRGVLVTYGINDKTLKFWNEKSGLLYKTLDLEKGITQLEINVNPFRMIYRNLHHLHDLHYCSRGKPNCSIYA